MYLPLFWGGRIQLKEEEEEKRECPISWAHSSTSGVVFLGRSSRFPQLPNAFCCSEWVPAPLPTASVHSIYEVSYPLRFLAPGSSRHIHSLSYFSLQKLSMSTKLFPTIPQQERWSKFKMGLQGFKMKEAEEEES